MISITDALKDALETLQKRSNNPDTTPEISTGFYHLDRLLGGFDNSDLIVIGARPAMGKTAFMLSLALNNAMKGTPVLFYSFEMSGTQITTNIITKITGVETYKITSGLLSANEWEKLTNDLKTLNEIPLYIIDSPSREIEDFLNEVKKDVAETSAKVVIVDYLQLLSSKEKHNNRYEEIALFTRELKHLARSLDIPIIIGSQINRNPEMRSVHNMESQAPVMADLRDSGTICEDANVVILLDRPEVRTHSYIDSCGCDIRGLVNVIVAKNHMGRSDTVKLRFKSDVCRLEDYDEFVDISGTPLSSNDLTDLSSGECNYFDSSDSVAF